VHYHYISFTTHRAHIRPQEVQHQRKLFYTGCFEFLIKLARHSTINHQYQTKHSLGVVRRCLEALLLARMSFVFLHVGQCGNQLGQAFWEEAGSSKWTTFHKPQAKTHAAQKTRPSPSPPSTFMPPIPYTLCDGFIPCVLVDAEPKAIRNCLNACASSRIAFSSRVREECIVTDRMGRGSNWAFGYHGVSRLGTCHEQSLLDRTMEVVRRTLERCDRFGGFIIFHSIAGGTGSGERSMVA